MDPQHKKILKEYHIKLLDIDPNENVLDHLLHRSIIQPTDYEDINKNGTKKARAQALLILLYSKGSKAFAALVEALETDGPDVHRELAACLREAAAASKVPVPLPESTTKPTRTYGSDRSGGDDETDGLAEASRRPLSRILDLFTFGDRLAEALSPGHCDRLAHLFVKTRGGVVNNYESIVTRHMRSHSRKPATVENVAGLIFYLIEGDKPQNCGDLLDMLRTVAGQSAVDHATEVLKGTKFR